MKHRCAGRVLISAQSDNNEKQLGSYLTIASYYSSVSVSTNLHDSAARYCLEATTICESTNNAQR